MKKIKILLYSSLSLLSLSACNDQLELTPYQSIPNEVALSSDENVRKVLFGAYDQLSAAALYGGNLLLFSELLAANQEIRWQGTFGEVGEVYNKSIVLNNSYVSSVWIQAYQTINGVNNVLNSLDLVAEADRSRIQGEALFIRSAVYFELVKLFGLPYSAGNTNSNLGVPLVLNATVGLVTEADYVSRSTVEEVYTQIINDLIVAEGLLPTTNGFYANKSVAASFLSRIYLQKEDYVNAADAANRAITNATGKTLTASYAEAFNTSANTTEDIFAIQVSAQDGSNQMHLFYSIPAFGGRDGDVAILQAHVNQYEEGDERLDLIYTYSGDFVAGKWREQYRNVKIVRLAELYLTRAEANFRLGTTVGATPLEDINRIRARVNLPALTTLTLDAILKERRLELAHEGHAIHDAKRTRRAILVNTVGSTQTLPYNDNSLVFPIPQRETDINPNLEPNP